MDIELLKTFIEVTQVRHFGRAAENLFLTPAAVSARIRQLEQMLGVVLLHRTRGNIQMTVEGERLLPHAKKLLRAWSDTLDDLSLKLETNNRLCIGAIASIWQCQLPQLNDAIIKRLATQQLHLESHAHIDLVAQILAQQLDAALLLDLPQHPELHAIKIAEQELALFSSLPTGHEIHAKHQSDELLASYIHIEWSAAFAAFHNKRVIAAEPLLRTTDAAVAVQLMQRLAATAYLPVTQAPTHLQRVPGTPRFIQTVYLAYKAGREHDNNLSALIAELKL